MSSFRPRLLQTHAGAVSVGLVQECDTGRFKRAPPLLDRRNLWIGSAKLEAEVVELPEEEAAEYLAMLGIETTGFEEFVRAAYRLLGLVTFFTAGEMESRAWTVTDGSAVRRAAGRIHTDMERGFIAAEVGDWRDIVSAGTWARAKEVAKVRLEGRDYIVKDGDTLLVRFNV